MSEFEGLRFVPSRVEGLPQVTEVIVFPDRLELLSAGQWKLLRFVDMVPRPRPVFLWRWLARLGWRRKPLTIGERDWFHPPAQRYFRFFTRPRTIVYLPDEPIGTGYASTLFRRIQVVMLKGGFMTWDLG
jgi:hypothetical protein